MDANIVDFDMDILEVIDGVIREHEAAVAGQLGKELQMVFGLEMWGEGIGKIVEWRKVVARRLGVSEEVKMKRVRPVQPVGESVGRQEERLPPFIRKVAEKSGIGGRDGEGRAPRFDRRSRDDEHDERRPPRVYRTSRDDRDGEYRPPRNNRRQHGTPAKKVDDFVPLMEGRQHVVPVDGEATGAVPLVAVQTPTTTTGSHVEAKERMDEQKTVDGADDAPTVLL